MQDLFEQIGITKEELIDRIVDKALGMAADYRQTGEESWEDIPLSEVVDDKITKVEITANKKTFVSPNTDWATRIREETKLKPTMFQNN